MIYFWRARLKRKSGSSNKTSGEAFGGDWLRKLFQKSKNETYKAEKFAKKPENETKLFSCDACGQTIEEKFNMKEHTNANHVEIIEVLETTKLKINEDTDLNKSVGM